jgi:hypothetical protein
MHVENAIHKHSNINIRVIFATWLQLPYQCAVNVKVASAFELPDENSSTAWRNITEDIWSQVSLNHTTL